MLVEEESVFINFYAPWLVILIPMLIIARFLLINKLRVFLRSKESKALYKTWNSLGKLCQKEGLTTIAQVNWHGRVTNGISSHSLIM